LPPKFERSSGHELVIVKMRVNEESLHG
jgi:hypothetical protein